MKKLLTLKRLLFLLTLFIGINAWSNEITFTYEDFTNTSYSTTEATISKSGFEFGHIQFMRNGSNGTPTGWAKDQVIQAKKTDATTTTTTSFYNKTSLGKITNIRVYLVINTNAFYVSYGSTSEVTDGQLSRPTTETGTVDMQYTTYAKGSVSSTSSTEAKYYDFDLSGFNASYFKIINGSGVLYIPRIVITYEDGGTVTPPATTVPAPVFDVAAGTYSEDQLVLIDNYNSDYIYAYTTDGTNPAFNAELNVTNGTVYDNDEGIEITSSCTLKAIAIDIDGNTSSITSAEYVINKPKTITALTVSGTPSKTTYTEGDAFDPAGLTVTATYSDGTTATITEGFDWEIDYGTENTALVAGATSVDVMAYTNDVMSEVYTVNGLTVTASQPEDNTGVTYTFESFTQGDDVTLYGNGYTITLHKNTGSTAPQWNANSNEARVYAKGSVVVKSTSDKKIEKIVYNYTINANNNGNAPTVDGAEGTTDAGSWDKSTKTWTGEDKEVTLATSGNAGNLGFKSITVYFVGGETPEPTIYTITIDDAIENGSVTASAASATAGTEITLTATPADGYTFQSWSITPSSVKVTDNKFTMPAENVTVSATFAEVSTPPSTDYIFYESFDTNKGSGGNDGKWSGSIASSAIKYDNEGWTSSKINGANYCAKIGTGSNAGSAETPEIGTLVVGQTYTLTFKAAAWEGDNTGLNISGTGCTLSKNSVTLKNSEWTDYTVTFTATDSQCKIKFEAAQASNNRFFLDEVKVVKGGEIVYTVATPVISGTTSFDEKTEVAISCETENAAIYYTLDGTAPTSASTLYTAPFELTATTTVKAIAIKEGMTNSAVASKEFVKNGPAPEIPEWTIAQFIANGGGKCYLTGVVSDIQNTTYGNYTLTDETGSIYIYGTLTPEGETKKFSTLDVVAGDKIMVLAENYTLYSGTIDEAVNVIFVKKFEVEVETIHVKNIAEFKALDENAIAVFDNPVTVLYDFSQKSNNTTQTTQEYIWVEDETGRVQIFVTPSFDPTTQIAKYENGDVIPAGFTVTKHYYTNGGYHQAYSTTGEGFTNATSKALAEPAMLNFSTFTSLTDNDVEEWSDRYILIKNVSFIKDAKDGLGRTYSISCNGVTTDASKYMLYNKYDDQNAKKKDGTSATVDVDNLDASKTYNVYGICQIYSGKWEIMPLVFEEYKPESLTLKELVTKGNAGETSTSTDYTISNDLQAVAAVDNILFLKDASGSAVNLQTKGANQKDYTLFAESYFTGTTPSFDTKNTKSQSEYDQSNWLELVLPQTVNASTYVNKIVTGGSIVGRYTDALNPKMALNENTELAIKGNAAEYYRNPMSPANFNGSQNGYFFVQPQPNEYVQVVYAVYKDGYFYMPTVAAGNTKELAGKVGIGDYSYNEYGTPALNNGSAYQFRAIIKKKPTTDASSSRRKITNAIFDILNCDTEAAFSICPLDLAHIDGIVTGIDDITVNSAVKAYKIIENGQVIIVRGDQRFNIMGQPVR